MPLAVQEASARLLHAWRRVTEPSPLVRDAAERRRARLLLSLSLPMAVLALASAIIVPFITEGVSPERALGAYVGFGSAIGMALVFALGRTRHHEIAALGFVAASFLASWFGFLFSRGVPGGGVILAFLATTLIVSSLLLSRKVTVAVFGVSLLAVALLPLLLDGVTVADIAIPFLFLAMFGVLVLVAVGIRHGDLERLEGSEARYRNLVELSPDAIVVQAAGRILYANPAAARIFGAPTPAALVGRDPFTLIHPDDADAVRSRLEATGRGGPATTPRETRLVRIDGATVEAEIMGAPAVFDGALADQTIIRDIKQRKDAEQARRLAETRQVEIERLREVNQFKTQILNTTSHELNTPITALKLQLHMLKAAGADREAQRAKALGVLDRNIERLALLVRDILDVARLDNGQLSVRKERVHLDKVLADALEGYDEPARVAGIRLDTQIAPGLVVEADPQRITQVIVNLVSNAIKFTPFGGAVHVQASATQEGALVRVRDTGMGLTADQMARLFQPFSQVHDASLAKGGTGLGLHISRGILDQHGGRIWCESDGPDEGCTFSFLLPLAERAPEAGIAPPA